MKHIMSRDSIDIFFIDYDGRAELIDLVSKVHKYDEDLLIYLITVYLICCLKYQFYQHHAKVQNKALILYLHDSRLI